MSKTFSIYIQLKILNFLWNWMNKNYSCRDTFYSLFLMYCMFTLFLCVSYVYVLHTIQYTKFFSLSDTSWDFPFNHSWCNWEWKGPQQVVSLQCGLPQVLWRETRPVCARPDHHANLLQRIVIRVLPRVPYNPIRPQQVLPFGRVTPPLVVNKTQETVKEKVDSKTHILSLFTLPPLHPNLFELPSFVFDRRKYLHINIFVTYIFGTTWGRVYLQFWMYCL